MKNLQIVSAAFLTAAVLNAPAANAVPRTFVSGATGLDSNTSFNCTKNKPCRNFSAAYTVTDAGGEIVVLDSANYGTLTISKALTIFAPPSVEGAVQVPTGGTGLTVSAGASDVVFIRNLVITTIPTNSGTTGLDHTSGKLVVEGVTFSGLDIGLNSTLKSHILDSIFVNNTIGLQVTGPGCDSASPPTCGTSFAAIKNIEFIANTTAISSINPGVGTNNVLIWNREVSTSAWSVTFTLNTTVMNSSGTGGVGTTAVPGNYFERSNPQ